MVRCACHDVSVSSRAVQVAASMAWLCVGYPAVLCRQNRPTCPGYRLAKMPAKDAYRLVTSLPARLIRILPGAQPLQAQTPNFGRSAPPTHPNPWHSVSLGGAYPARRLAMKPSRNRRCSARSSTALASGSDSRSQSPQSSCSWSGTMHSASAAFAANVSATLRMQTGQSATSSHVASHASLSALNVNYLPSQAFARRRKMTCDGDPLNSDAR